MASLLPLNFPAPANVATPIYNYEDIASGLGYAVFYLAENMDGEGILTDQVLYSDAYANWSTTTLDVDHDTSAFLTPRTLKGVVYVNLSARVSWVNAGGVSGSGTLTPTIYIRKYSDSTETTLASDSGSVKTVTGSTASASRNRMYCIAIDVPQTHFKRGDILRITVALAGSGTGYSRGYGIDPKDRAEVSSYDGGGLTITQSTAYVPWRIED